MSHRQVSEIDFALACLRATGTKPDFGAVAAELGCSSNQAYHRHWRMMRNSNMNPVVAAAGRSTAPKTPSKRGRKPKAAKDVDHHDDFEDDEEEADKKKVKITPEGKGKAKAKAVSEEEVIKVEDDDEEVEEVADDEDDAATITARSEVISGDEE